MMRLGLLTLVLLACGGDVDDSEPGLPPPTEGGEQPRDDGPTVLEIDPHGEEVVERLEAITDISLEEWEREVLSILVGTYDFDASGAIDTDVEVHRVVCEVWRTLDRELRRRSHSETSLRDAYGFAPGQVWQNTLGIDVSQREHLRQDLLDCGVR